MVKHKLKRLLALALSVLLLSSEISGLMLSARAEETAPAAEALTGEQLNFRNQNNGRPNLFVDFLGDNNTYRPDGGASALGTLVAPAGYDQSKKTNATGPNNKWEQYVGKDVEGNQAYDTIFWVGVGIDRKEIFELLEDDRGLTSFEGGFYYDREVIEPYYDPALLPAGANPAAPTQEEIAEAYRATIARSNINNTDYPANTQWGGNYRILRAEADLDPATDLITQEEIANPSIDQILEGQYNDGYDRNWRMTYVSLELADITDQNRRLKGVYEGIDRDADGNPLHPEKYPAAQGTGLETGENQSESDYQYLLLIPFRLKKYGGEGRLHLRLLRNATHFSMGAGEYGASTYGETEDDSYAAWERVTTRNPDRDLKLLTNFAGDLYLFNADPPRVNDEAYTAELKIINGGSTENTARLEVDGDPAVWPVWADKDGERIEQLYSGLGMKLKVHAQIGYTASVKVTYPTEDGTVYHYFYSDVPREVHPGGGYSYPDQQDSNHTFVIPVFDARIITVTVTFQHVTGDDFRVFLSEIPQPGDADYKTGNETTITTNLDANFDPTADSNVINSFDAAVPHPNSSHTGITHADGPMGMGTKDRGVRIHVETHADYEVLVRTYNFLQQNYTIDHVVQITAVGGTYSTDNRLQLETGTDGDGHPIYTPNPDYGILLPLGGDITFTMGASDIDVEVIYRKAKRHKATLEVYHAGNDPVLDTNVAQLAYLAYDAENVASMAYSGIIYEDDTKIPSDHRAVKNPTVEPSRKLPWVSSSAATLSGSLGGDTGRVGKVWHPSDLDTPLDPEAGSGTIMALLAGAPDLATFRTQLNGLDLSTTVIKDGSGSVAFTGLRKNLYGDFYSDADAGDFADILWELRLRIDADTSANGLKDTYHKSVPKSDTDATVAYEYYDLTAAQVQDYLLSIFQKEDADNKNQSGYREVRRAYLAAKQIYDELMAKDSYKNDLKPIVAPQAPNQMSVDANGLRKYEEPAYLTFHIHSYSLYIEAYRKYVEAAKASGSALAADVVQLWQDELLDQHTANVQNTYTPEAVPIHTPADAANNVAGQTWKTSIIKPDATPDAGEDPAKPASTIYTRDGRTVWVALEADSAYEVARVELYSQDEDGNAGALITTVTPALAAGYQNVFSFTMPEEDCVVRVTYGLRTTRKLNITYKGADGKKDNVSVVEAYQVAIPADTKPALAKRTNENNLNTDPFSPSAVESVFVGSTVTVRVNVDEDYEVELRAVNADGSTYIPINTPAIPAGETLPRDGVYTFLVPASQGDLQLTITYKPANQKTNKATIEAITPTGPGSLGNKAFWRDGTLKRTIENVAEHTLLTGEINVAPGYYIRAVRAYGESGSYTYTLTGNGYNGGFGTSQTGTEVPINVYANMPGENLTVQVIFAYGIPPAAPENLLTLTVKDTENEKPYVDNWAKATVYDSAVPITDTTTTPAFVLGEVGHTHGQGEMSQKEYATEGQWVKVEFGAHTEKKEDGKIDPAKSYYVSKVTVGPSNLGISMVWEDDHTASFFMPAGSTGVTVEFSKYPDNGRLPDYVLTVSETYRDLNAIPVGMTQDDYNKNYVTFANSATIRGWNGGAAVPLQPYNMETGKNNPERVPATTQTGATGVATAGELVTMTFVVDEGPDENNVKWYVQSVVVISDGAAYRGTYKQVGVNGTQKIYTAEFRMPTGDAEFIVHYRRGPRPATPDYAFTLSLTDDDNVPDEESGAYDENNIVASFVDASGINAAGHADLEVGHNKAAMTDVRHVHAGDTVTLTTTLAPGYTIDYMLVNPTGLHLHPVWTSYVTAPDGVVTAISTLTMPPEGIAVVARIIKGEPQKYTANLILRPPQKPDGSYYPMSEVGQGTFAGLTGGSLTNYHQSAVFSTYATPGVTIPYDLYAFDGYYIDRVTVDPDLGVTGTLSGAFGAQDGEFTMPAANVNVNVWFKKGWPDEVKYRLTLEVFGPAYHPENPDNNYANFAQVVHTDATGATVFTPTDSDPVYSGGRKHLRAEEGVAFDRDTVYVNIHKIAGSYVDSSSIRITDSGGNVISWWYAPGGIAFTMPPRSTTVRINFKQITTPLPTHTATLYLVGDGAGDSAELSTAAANATGDNPATANGQVISDLLAGDVLTLEAQPGTDRHITAAYAVEETTGRIIDLTRLNGDGHRVRSAFVYGGDNGEFAMPEDNVRVYVKFGEGAVEQDDLPLTLMVSGPAESNPDGGHGAAAEVTGLTPAQNKTMEVDAPGMDTRFVKAGNRVEVTFDPNKDKGYAISKLEVYDADGNPVPYEWISVLQDPPTADLDDPTVWPGTAPEDIAKHPGWKRNPKLQITFDMPAKGVVVHVTYAKTTDTQYKAQIVVNDEGYSDQPVTSRNNASFQDDVIKKLRYAKPGEWVDLHLFVHPGYRIEYVKVVPQSFGIVPGLPLGPFFDQSTGFVMPEGDVTVYVKFADDGEKEYNATLVVTGAPTGDLANYATIISSRSHPNPPALPTPPATTVTNPAPPTPVYVNGHSALTTARPEVDWITTDYYWRTDGSAFVQKVTVTTASGANVPFTQQADPATGHGKITFPMVNENVVVKVEYGTTEVKAKVYLHVIDDTVDPEAAIGAFANATLRDPGNTTLIGMLTPLRPTAADPWGNTGGPEGVAAGQTVKLRANASVGDGVYLRSAYVLYEDVGQMVGLTYVNGAADGSQQEKSFVVHPGENHVYVTFTRTQPDPNEHSAILMLRAPEDDAGRASIAAGGVYDSPAATDQDSLDRANHGHAEVIATRGQRVYIQVAPAEGYIIDTVLVTPLGFPLKTHAAYNYTMVGNTISFDMPHRDVAITVTLKRGTNQHYNVRLHYLKDTADVSVDDAAILTWMDGSVAMDLRADLQGQPADVWEKMVETQIREGTEVTLTGHLAKAADPAKPDTILSAFVLRSNGSLVTLDPPLEGEEADAAADTDHAALFTMPAADVDVFLVVTTEPPTTPWYTTVLVATDTSPSQVNSGDNFGYLWKNGDEANREKANSKGSLGCVWIPVAEGDTIYVQPEEGPSYSFVPPATDTCNDGAHGGNMHTESTSPYRYSDTIATCNKAALIHFVSDDALDLTVILRDPENPSDGTATQTLLTRQPTATPPVDELTLTSANVGGAYQIMKGVTPGQSVLITATPADGFVATAQIRYIDGSVAEVTLTEQNGVWTGSFPMPSSNATLIVTFHGNYEGTLKLVDESSADKTEQATMHENSVPEPRRVTVNHMGNEATLKRLPQGTLLTANMLRSANLANKAVTVLLTVENGGTSFMSPSGINAEGVSEYEHAINRADATITFVVRDKDDPTYVAAVNAVNKPAGTADPTIKNNTNAAAAHAADETWTAAAEDDRVVVTLDVPVGYEARLSVDNGLTLNPVGPIPGLATGRTTQFIMPAANVQVTVTYVRTEFDLTLRVYASAGTNNPTKVGYDPADPTAYLAGAQNGDTAQDIMVGGETITLLEATADAAAGATFLTATYSSADGSFGYLNVNDTFTMPQADTVVTVRYGRADPPPDDPDPYLALVEVVDGDGMPGNAAIKLVNSTHGTLPGVSPYWVEGLTGDAIRVNYTIEPGYIARVTARRRGEPSTAATLYVSTTASPSNGMSTVAMPGGTDIIIRIEYVKDDGPKEGDVILQLVQHGAQEGNCANVTSPFAAAPGLGLLATNGTAPGATTTTTNSFNTITGDATSPVETDPVSTSLMGNELFVYANWANSYQVVRMTIAVRDNDGNETPEVPIAISRYGSAAAGRTLMPYVDETKGEAAVVRVYYGNIFWARLHIVPHGTDNRDVNGNTTSATDDRATTVTSVPGSSTINRDGDRLLDFMGNDGETVQTYAKPDKDAPNNQRLVGVVWESASTGAASAAPRTPDTADPRYSTDHYYDFEMPADNVDFYAVYEEDDPDNRSYIAKVTFEGTEHLGSGQNAVTITNKSDNTAAHGAYWTAAKKDENVVVNVKVAPGYKAEIIKTYKDHIPTADHTPPYDFYINRVEFVPNLTLGKDASFSMPADTDATVTIRFTKGYDLSLEVVDSSKLADGAADPARLNKATVTTNESPARKLEGTSAKEDGTDVTYNTDPPVLKAVDRKKLISTAVTAATKDAKTALYKVYRYSTFTGTQWVDVPTPATQPYEYEMPEADVDETVVFYNENTPLLAKVEVKGESDINGNSAKRIVDHTDTTSPDGGTTPAANQTVIGTVWTTTSAKNTIDVTLTVAKGYVAKIRVRRDNDNYYNNPTDESKWDWLDFEDYVFTEVYETTEKIFSERLSGDPQTDEVQMGYKSALIKDPSQFDAHVSGDQHFRFTMAYDVTDGEGRVWTASDVTVIVEFVFAGNIPQPFDPRNVKDDDFDHKPEFLEQGFIYGENRGDFAVVEIPTLIQKIADGEELFHSNNHTSVTGTVDKKNDVTFSFYLYDADKDEYTPLTLGTDVLLVPYDTEDTDTYTDGDPYNYYKGDDALWTGPNHWHPTGLEDDVQFTGSKFKLIPTPPKDVVEDGQTVSKRTDGAEALYQMLNNKGSLESYEDEEKNTKYRTTLYVMAEDTIGQKSAYTQVWIRPHFTVELSVISYAPNHATTASLYQPTPTPAPAVEEPWRQNSTDYTGEALPANQYHQRVGVMSSELLGDFTSAYDPDPAKLLTNVDKTAADNGDFTYKLTVEKASCLTYTRVDLDLSPYLTGFDLTAGTYPDYYNDKTLTYSIADAVYLITGDVNGDGYTKWQDYDAVYTYVWRGYPWNNTQTEAPDPKAADYAQRALDWRNSTYNPDSSAYRCDLNGDRVLSVQDLELVQTRFNYNRSAEDYKWEKDGVKVLPFGFGEDKKDYVSLFSLAWADYGVFPVEADPFWSQLVDPESTDALPLDAPYVQNDGFREDAALPGDGGGADRPSGDDGGQESGPRRRRDEVVEIPVGEEILGKVF